MLKTVFFDLDGTLLPMDQDTFIKSYFAKMACRMAPHGYPPQALMDSLWKGVAAMVKNDGSATNEQVFWQVFTGLFGEKAREDAPILEDYYRTDFQAVRQDCGFDPRAAQTVQTIRRAGLETVLATNPVFPRIATYSRVRWAGLDPEQDFSYITTYENSRFCKPSLQYYKEILDTLGLDPSQCLMVGNDVGEDMVAKELGMEGFLLTDCLINRENKDISAYPQGSFPELLAYLQLG